MAARPAAAGPTTVDGQVIADGNWRITYPP